MATAILCCIHGQDLEDHLYSDKVPSQFASEQDRLAAAMDPVFKNKMVGCNFSHEIWMKIEDYFSKSIKCKIKQLKSQLKFIKRVFQLQSTFSRTMLDQIAML
ncbi:hypothetical protein AHAS_Ahas02G0068800 [Arachis hypogaea]